MVDSHTTNLGFDLLNAVAKRIRDLDLDEIQSVDVQARPLREDQIVPGAFVSPPTRGNGEWEKYGGGHFRSTQSQIAIGYGCQVTVVNPNLDAFDRSPNVTLDWRQALRQTFHDKRLNMGDNETDDTTFRELACTVEPGEWQGQPESEYDITVMVVRCWVLH